MLIPSIISDETEGQIQKKLSQMENSKESVCVQYTLDKNRRSLKSFHQMLKRFRDNFLFGRGDEILLSYSQKIEKRKLGNTRGIQGYLKWQSDEEATSEPKKYDFLLLEYEHANESGCFAFERCIKIHLKPTKGSISKEVIEVLRVLDSVWAPELEGVHRSLACKSCHEEEKEGYVLLDKGLKLIQNDAYCQSERGCNQQHELEEKLRAMLVKPLHLTSLLEGIDASSLEEFNEHSTIRKQMLERMLDVGQQIWIFHNKETNRLNCIARVNPYAHVVIYASRGVQCLFFSFLAVQNSSIGLIVRALLAHTSYLSQAPPAVLV